MLSSPILHFLCLIFICLGQIPSMVSSMLAVNSSPSNSNNSRQFEEDLFEAAGLNFTRFDNQTHAIFEKVIDVILYNVAMTEEEQTELASQFFDVADENKDGQLTSEEATQTIMYLAIHFFKKYINQHNINENDKALILKLMKELAPELWNEAKKCAIEIIKCWDRNDDGKLSKKETEENIKAEMKSKNTLEMGKFKRAVDMKMAMENVVNGHGWLNDWN